MNAVDRVIAITGASAGIGRAVADRAAALGAAVVLNARRAALLDDAVSAIVARGGRAVAVPGDVTRAPDMQTLVDAAIAAFGRLDVMVCNAGIGFHDTFERTAPDVMRRLVDVNVMGTLYAAHAAMPHFRARGAGHVIAVSSIVGRRGIAGSVVYSATKAAQIGLIEGLRAETAGTAIHASIVYPVSTRTEFRAAQARDFGLHVEGAGPAQSADHVARAIVDCIERPRPEVYPYPAARLLAIVSVVAPRLSDRLVRKYSRRAHTAAAE